MSLIFFRSCVGKTSFSTAKPAAPAAGCPDATTRQTKRPSEAAYAHINNMTDVEVGDGQDGALEVLRLALNLCCACGHPSKYEGKSLILHCDGVAHFEKTQKYASKCVEHRTLTLRNDMVESEHDYRTMQDVKSRRGDTPCPAGELYRAECHPLNLSAAAASTQQLFVFTGKSGEGK